MQNYKTKFVVVFVCSRLLACSGVLNSHNGTATK